MSEEMTRKDIESLIKVVNQRARLAGQQIDAAKAQRIAEFEADAIREWDVQMLGIEEAVAEANREVDAIRQRLEGRLDELGIPDHARPRLSGVALYAQRSADRDFRNDLRKQITTEVDAGAKAAKVQIETEKLNVTEQLVVRSLDTREARELIESLPSADSLLPSVDTSALVQRALEAGGRR